VGRTAGTVPAVLNAANEVCVDAFCAGRLSFLGIVDTVAAVVAAGGDRTDPGGGLPTLDDIRSADAWARRTATGMIEENA
jgi:1-deoxy-D-xylulose-5-phosphate reductoisomerase